MYTQYTGFVCYWDIEEICFVVSRRARDEWTPTLVALQLLIVLRTIQVGRRRRSMTRSLSAWIIYSCDKQIPITAESWPINILCEELTNLDRSKHNGIFGCGWCQRSISPKVEWPISSWFCDLSDRGQKQASRVLSQQHKFLRQKKTNCSVRFPFDFNGREECLYIYSHIRKYNIRLVNTSRLIGEHRFRSE